jgi:CheY-like chemotaxis protein
LPIKILVVEDEAVIALDFQLRLEEMGHHVKTVSSGEMALKLMDNENFNLVFMDVSLNGELDGIETARIIRNENPNIHVVFVTGSSDLNQVKDIDTDEECKYLSKPLEGTALKEIIGNYTSEECAAK